jgi:hypothetical protein
MGDVEAREERRERHRWMDGDLAARGKGREDGNAVLERLPLSLPSKRNDGRRGQGGRGRTTSVS